MATKNVDGSKNITRKTRSSTKSNTPVQEGENVITLNNSNNGKTPKTPKKSRKTSTPLKSKIPKASPANSGKKSKKKPQDKQEKQAQKGNSDIRGYFSPNKDSVVNPTQKSIETPSIEAETLAENLQAISVNSLSSIASFFSADSTMSEINGDNSASSENNTIENSSIQEQETAMPASNMQTINTENNANYETNMPSLKGTTVQTHLSVNAQ